MRVYTVFSGPPPLSWTIYDDVARGRELELLKPGKIQTGSERERDAKQRPGRGSPNRHHFRTGKSHLDRRFDPNLYLDREIRHSRLNETKGVTQ